MRRRNPLLVKPPRHFHGISDEYKILRHGWPDPKLGVHTATDEEVCAAYALSTYQQEGGGIPIVVTLDISGLTPEPDTDAILWWYRGGDYQIREAMDLLEEDPDALIGDVMLENMTDDDRLTTVSSYLLNRIESLEWDTAAQTILENGAAALGGDIKAIRNILVAGFVQHRFMNDFDLDRLLKVETFKLWEDRLVLFDDAGNYDNDPDPDDPGDPDEEGSLAWIEAAEAAGKKVVYEQDVHSFSVEWKTLWDSGRRVNDFEYHGMSSLTLDKAFPGLKWR